MTRKLGPKVTVSSTFSTSAFKMSAWFVLALSGLPQVPAYIPSVRSLIASCLRYSTVLSQNQVPPELD